MSGDDEARRTQRHSCGIENLSHWMIFLVCAAPLNIQQVIHRWHRNAQRRPRPDVALLVHGQDDRHWLRMDRLLPRFNWLISPDRARAARDHTVRENHQQCRILKSPTSAAL
ncbi:hypothetical protein JQ607_10455 [Bradyrhizobium liaoningense]|uniref:hypothetical protein n=1 Tax=Bradyrhizobium liaoningense TaxID=43992 RepID=UPI001BA90AD2|nr:hypothetical protein [Bradyrhizobium liaoningense]MBR0840607.1 hypothetical protein [Bradyrhizobium liaoningense]